MLREMPLIATIVGGLGLAFVFGAIANRFRIPPIVGYLFAGIAVGTFTPGFIADQGLASQLAELGVILLMFGVGLHFSLEDLLSVRAIALPGAIVQIVIATSMGCAMLQLEEHPLRTVATKHCSKVSARRRNRRAARPNLTLSENAFDLLKDRR
jgi:CPA2 family monovalent cation:H+ antiporter-2